MQLPIPVLFSATVYFLVGFQPLASKFFIFTGFMLLCTQAGACAHVADALAARFFGGEANTHRKQPRGVCMCVHAAARPTLLDGKMHLSVHAPQLTPLLPACFHMLAATPALCTHHSLPRSRSLSLLPNACVSLSAGPSLASTATSLALMVSTWCRGIDLAVSVLPMMLEVSRLFGAFFLSPANTPAHWRWLDSLSYVRWTYVGISLNELSGLTLTCTPAQLAAAGGACPVTSGEQTIMQLGLNRYSMPLCAGVLLVFIAVCRTLAYAGLRVLKW